MEKAALKYGRPDIERLGLFIEMPYMPADQNKSLVDPKKKQKEVVPDLGLSSMLGTGHKLRSANMDGYFNSTFTRVFEGERKLKKDMDRSRTPPPLPMIPAGASKHHSCPGDFYGTFGGPINSFSPKLTKVKPKYMDTKRNIITNPGKKGGPGFANLTIGSYPVHSSERDDKKRLKGKGLPKEEKPPMIVMHWPKPYFYPNPYSDDVKGPPTRPTYIPPKEKPDKKWSSKPKFIPTGPAKGQGGCHAGCFERWPVHQPDKYLSPEQVQKVLEKKREDKKLMQRMALKPTFMPTFTAMKSMFVQPVLSNVNFTMNSTNWKDYKPTFVNHLL